MSFLHISLFLVSLQHQISGESFSPDPNEDIVTVLKHVLGELKELKKREYEQETRENATERIVELLKTQNAEMKETINSLKKDVKTATAEVKSEIKRFKNVEEDVKAMKDILTSPLPGKTWQKPSESCDWLDKRYYNLQDGKYWTKVDGKPHYGQCKMSGSGIPPVRCTSKTCHEHALCENIETGVKCTCACGYSGDGKDCRKSFRLPSGKGKMLLSEPCGLKGGNLLTTFKHVLKEYSVHFELFPLEFQTGPLSIIHFTTGGDCCDVGQRIPGVWMSGGIDLLYLCYPVNDIGDFCKYGHDTKIPLRRWTKVEIKQQIDKTGQYIYSIAINGRQVMQVVNTKPRIFRNVQVYVADGWYPTHKGYIRNLYVDGCE